MKNRKSKIPQIVYDEFEGFIEHYGESGLRYIGERDSKKYYEYEFPAGLEVGFPQVIAIKDGKIERIDGFDTFRVFELFRRKD